MRPWDLIKMALRNLWKRKFRTFLTILGVIIGTASIAVMVSIGIGIDDMYRQQISSYGSLQTIQVYKSYNYENPTEEKNITKENIDKLFDYYQDELPPDRLRFAKELVLRRANWIVEYYKVNKYESRGKLL